MANLFNSIIRKVSKYSKKVGQVLNFHFLDPSNRKANITTSQQHRFKKSFCLYVIKNNVIGVLKTIICVLASSVYAPKVQQPAPDFAGLAVINDSFKNIQLSDYKGKYVVLFFYPLDL